MMDFNPLLPSNMMGFNPMLWVLTLALPNENLFPIENSVDHKQLASSEASC